MFACLVKALHAGRALDRLRSSKAGTRSFVPHLSFPSTTPGLLISKGKKEKRDMHSLFSSPHEHLADPRASFLALCPFFFLHFFPFPFGTEVTTTTATITTTTRQCETATTPQRKQRQKSEQKKKKGRQKTAGGS